MLKGKLYDAAKQVAQIWLPALGTLYFTMAGIWHLPNAEQVVGSIVAIDTFLGVVLHINTIKFNASDDKFDGVFAVDTNEDGGQSLRLKSVDYNALNTKSELIFKIQDGIKAPPRGGDLAG
jgi:hypothetical protein